MPELLPDGLPDRPTRSRFDFSEWADGRAWKFVRGEDYTSSTQTFRYNVHRWAKKHGYAVETRPLNALDADGSPLSAKAADPLGLGVRFAAGPAASAVGRGRANAHADAELVGAASGGGDRGKR